MAPAPKTGGRLATRSTSDAPLVGIRVKVEGVDRTTEEFKQIRATVNTALRDAMAAAGERAVIPAIKSALPKKNPAVKAGLPSGKMASSITIKRDRLDVLIKSTLPKNQDRALGWIDFGGKRPRDTKVRVGPHVLVSTLTAKADAIDKAVLDELARQFNGLDFQRG